VGSYRFAHSASNQIVSAWGESGGNLMHIERWASCAAETRKTITKPKVENKNWGSLVALANSDQPKKVCLLGSIPFYSGEYVNTCVNILK